jgi:mannosyltransferase OCH1-like enzyme
MTILRSIHQIWLGPNPSPDRWLATWRTLNPGSGYRLWDESSIAAFHLQHGDLYHRYLEAGLFDGAADIARVEILHRLGGVYVDADSIALRPLDGAWFLEAGFFAALEPTAEHPGLVSNAFMGSRPGHPVLARYLAAFDRVNDLRPMWKLTGPGALTEALTSREPDVEILPSWTFFPTALSGDDPRGGDPYAAHFWSTTAERWGRPGTTPYPRPAQPPKSR